MQSSEQSNRINSAGFEALAKIRSQEPVFSLYLDVRFLNQGDGSLSRRFNQLLLQAEQEARLDQSSAAYHQQWDQEAARIRHWLESQRRLPGTGLALFSSQAVNLWQVFALSVSLPDRLVVRGEPYARPLQVLLGEFSCTLVVLAGEGLVHLIQVFMGSAQEVENLQGVPVTGDALEIGPRLVARAVAERVEAFWQEQPCGRLVIAGSPEILNALREELSEPLRQRLAGEIPLDPQAGLEEVLANVQELEADQEQQLEAQRVETLLARAKQNQGAVLGAEQSLLAVRDQRADLLVVEEDFHAPGGECLNCGFLGIFPEQQGAGRNRQQEVCPLCGMALRPEPDVIEVTLKRVLDQGGEIEVLRSPASRRALQAVGRIGALIHQPGERIVRDSATQRVISRDGKINRDVLHDETIEESFPASDPPGWTP